jgi:hypothetical protein
LLARHRCRKFLANAFDLGTTSDFLFARSVEVSYRFSYRLREAGERTLVTLLFQGRGLQLTGKALVFFFHASPLGGGARGLAVEREAHLLGLHKLIAQVRKVAHGLKQGLPEGLDLAFALRQLCSQILLSR